MGRLKLCSVTAFAALIGALYAPCASAAEQAVAVINRGVVEIETSGSAGISVRIAEDLANLVDDGATRRVVPVVGKGSLQSLTDLKYLRGIDMAIVQSDVLDYAKEQKLLPGLEASMTYITRLYNEEFHLLAGPKIKNVGELANKKVNVDLRGSGTSITAGRLFEMLNIPVTLTNDSQEVALDTVAVGNVLLVADLRQSMERSRNVANFVDVFFTGFQSLLEPGHHPKWREVNLTAELPGWHRYQPAEQWLQRNMQIANAPKPDDLKAMFAHFIDEHRRSAGGAPMTAQEKEDLFQQYSRWQTGAPR